MSNLNKKIKWLFDRWKIMDHPKEEIYRVGQQIQYRFTDRKWSIHNPGKGLYQYSFACNCYSLEGLRTILNDTFTDIYHYPVLNIMIDNIVENNKWNYDVKNKKEGQCKFIHSIDDFNYELGDARYLYELGRIHWAPMLTAYAIAKDDKMMIQHVKEMLYKWSEQNPFLKTIAWKSGNEVGIRVINLIYMHILLKIYETENDDRFENFIASLIERHFIYLKSHQSLYSSDGNHHIGELAGMIAVCSVYRFKNNEKLLESFFEELQTDFMRLIAEDGFNREQSTNYQTSYLNLMVTAAKLAEHKGLCLSNECSERLKKAYGALLIMRIKKNEYYHLGDTDNAELLFPYADKEYNIYESMLNDSAIVYGTGKTTDYHFDIRNYLLFGDYGMNRYQNAEEIIQKPQCLLMKESGYFIVHDHDINLLFDCGPIGAKPTMCHGHSDILSILLYVKGEAILVDCGCYQYNDYYRKYRDYFHGVTSHNTVSIDGQNQAQLGSGMFWLTYPEAKVLNYDTEGNIKFCHATHNGYQDIGVEVSRRVDFSELKHEIIITDIIATKGAHEVGIHFHFHPNFIVTQDNDVINVAGVEIQNSLFNKGKLYLGNEEKPYGWFSERYDKIDPTYSFIATIKVDGCIESKTVIKY